MSFRICWLIPVLVLGSRAPAHAQRSNPPGADPDERTATVLVGGGNGFGGFGANGSLYFSGRRWSVHGGLGYVPESELGHPFGAAWAVGVRRYTAGPRSQWFVGVQYCLLATVAEARPDPPAGNWQYGPTLTGGWQYTAASSFTFLAALGVGYSGSDYGPSILPALDIGFGLTW